MSDLDDLRCAVRLLGAWPGLGLSSRALVVALALGEPLDERRIGARPMDHGDLAGNWETYELIPAAWKPRARAIIEESARRVYERYPLSEQPA
jgi:hypothetical protein